MKTKTYLVGSVRFKRQVAVTPVAKTIGCLMVLIDSIKQANQLPRTIDMIIFTARSSQTAF